MKDSKLMYFIRLLPAEELKLFRSYLNSLAPNEHSSVVRLFEVIYKELILENNTMSHEEIYQAIYGDLAYKPNSLKTSMSRLQKLVLQFMPYRRFQEDSILQNRLLLEKLNELGEKKYFPKFREKAFSALTEAVLPVSDLYLEKLLLEESDEMYHLRAGGRNHVEGRDLPGESLSNAFLARVLRYQLRVLSLRSSLKVNDNHPFFGLALQFVAENFETLPLTLQLYHRFCESFSTHEDLGRYYQARELLSRSVRELYIQDAQELYTASLNFCSHHLNDGKGNFLRPTFEVYQEMVELGFLTSNGNLSPFHCKNIVTVALRLEEFEWASDFLHEWQDKVFPDYAKNTYHFNQGLLSYYQADFQQASKYFYKVLEDYQDIFYALNAKGYLLQIHYETSNIRSLESQMHSFRMFLNRASVLSDKKKKQYLDFINHLNRLSKIAPFDERRLKKLRDAILQKEFPGMGASWLLSKIAEMEKKPN